MASVSGNIGGIKSSCYMLEPHSGPDSEEESVVDQNQRQLDQNGKCLLFMLFVGIVNL